MSIAGMASNDLYRSVGSIGPWPQKRFELAADFIFLCRPPYI